MTDDWASLPPQDAGFAADLGDKLDAGVRSGLLRHLHAVLVARSGRIVLERYFAGQDAATLHDIRSVTKSVVGLLYGIALDRGLVPPPEAPLLASFPDLADLATDPRRSRLTVAHALTMTMGLAWDEQRPYTDPLNSEIAMEAAPDRTRFALDRPIVAAPGLRWIYSGGAVALLGSLIARGAGTILPDFARAALFEPMGIRTFEWARGRDGIASAASGLRLRPRDLLRLGRMVLDGGRWNGRAIVPADWIAASRTPAVPTDCTTAGSGTSATRPYPPLPVRKHGWPVSATAANGCG
jgi:CubicO group peptidase (beta-lactamase class C family)